MVWTGDGRVFFYNPSSRTSVWERPEELVGRADVDKMVASPPESVQQTPQADSTTTNNTSTTTSETQAVKRENQDESDASAAKKPKLETPAKGKT